MSVDGPTDPTKWKVRNNGGIFTADSVTLAGGAVLVQGGLFTGLELAARYFGPPPTYYNARGTPMAAWGWWYW